MEESDYELVNADLTSLFPNSPVCNQCCLVQECENLGEKFIDCLLPKNLNKIYKKKE